MALWCIMASPLIMSVDLRTVKPYSRSLLLNRRALAINQDCLGVQGRRIAQVSLEFSDYAASCDGGFRERHYYVPMTGLYPVM